MSANTSAAGSPDRPSGGHAHDASGTVAPADRGTTVIPERVVARIAARVVSTMLRRRFDPRSDLAAPGARATTHGGRAQLALTVDLPYPADIADTSRQLQREVADRVTRLTGLEVRDVTLTIRRLATVGGPVRAQ
ncbi:hypothetical protein GTY85_15160 [Streptomyces sp. SID8377]|nr:hypothetical protein [Streptomyces sp. SID8377]